MKRIDTIKRIRLERDKAALAKLLSEGHEGQSYVKSLRRSIARREREQAYGDLGMVKVRGAMGGTYYE